MKRYADQLTWHALFVICYALLSFIVISLAPSSAYQSVFWPCSGIALAFTIFFGYRAIFSILLGGSAVYFFLNYNIYENVKVLKLVVVVILPALQAALACFLVNFYNGRNYWLFNHWRRFLGFIFWGGIVPAIPLSVGMTFCVAYGQEIALEEMFYVGLSVFAGNALGVLIITPCLLLLAVKNNRISNRNRFNSIIPVLLLFAITLLGYMHLYHIFKNGIGFKHQAELDKVGADIQRDFSRISGSYQSARYYFMANKTLVEKDFYRMAHKIYDSHKQNYGEPFFGFGLIQLQSTQTSQFYQLTKVYPVDTYRFLQNSLLFDQFLDLNHTVAVSDDFHFLANSDALRSANGDFLLIAFQSEGKARQDSLIAIIFDATAFFKSIFDEQASHFKAIKVDDITDERSFYTNDINGLFGNTDNAIHEQLLTLGNLTFRITCVYDIQWVERKVQRHLLLMAIVALSLIGVFTVMILGALVGLHSLVSLVNKQSLDLENEKRFLDCIFDHLPVLISVKDAKTRRYLRVNKSMEKFYGVERGHFKGKVAADVFSVDQALVDTKFDDVILAEENVVESEGQWEFIAGQKHYVSTKKLPVYDALGEVIYILGISEDLTEKLESQNHLAKRNELISLGLDATGLGSWEWRLIDNQFVVSPTLCAILGIEFDGATIAGQAIESLILEEDVAQLLAVNEIAKYSLEVTEFCCRVRRRDGCIIWVSGKYRYFMADDNTIARALGVLWDSTAENLLQQDNIKKTEELKRSNAELDSFAYIASHDLKEPLRGISNYATFLQEDYADKLDENGIAMLKSVVRLTGKMDTLISDLLNYSRLGRTEFAYKITDIDIVIVDVLESLLPRLSELNIHVYYLSPMPKLWCDSVRIAEVFRNLITNAMKYNDSPHKIIELDCAREQDMWVFSVSDNGIGIAPAFQYRVFDMFKRLHGQQEYGGGSGVGLSIVQKIVMQHDGKVDLKSIFGEGTTVSFSLPVNSAASQ